MENIYLVFIQGKTCVDVLRATGTHADAVTVFTRFKSVHA
jgi:hypothetical protein